MSETVVNAMKDRSKCMRRLPSGDYEYGWIVYHRRDRSKDTFTVVGTGTMTEAEEWMAVVGSVKLRRSVYVNSRR